MSKITFRADDDLVERLEEFDASKSEVMREALREYLGEPAADLSRESDSVDDAISERVDAAIAERLGAAAPTRTPRDVNVNITLEGDTGDAAVSREGRADSEAGAREPETASDGERKTCNQCGESLPQSAVYCQNCGGKTSHRVFCECGDELRSDWGFCPSCGRRTPAADVLDGT